MELGTTCCETLQTVKLHSTAQVATHRYITKLDNTFIISGIPIGTTTILQTWVCENNLFHNYLLCGTHCHSAICEGKSVGRGPTNRQQQQVRGCDPRWICPIDVRCSTSWMIRKCAHNLPTRPHSTCPMLPGGRVSTIATTGIVYFCGGCAIPRVKNLRIEALIPNSSRLWWATLRISATSPIVTRLVFEIFDPQLCPKTGQVTKFDQICTKQRAGQCPFRERDLAPHPNHRSVKHRRRSAFRRRSIARMMSVGKHRFMLTLQDASY